MPGCSLRPSRPGSGSRLATVLRAPEVALVSAEVPWALEDVLCFFRVGGVVSSSLSVVAATFQVRFFVTGASSDGAGADTSFLGVTF
jgi:hypothetical protein